MLAQEMFFQDYVPYAIWAGCGALVLGGLFLSRLRVLIIIGVAIPLVGLPMLSAQKLALSFEVTIVEDALDENAQSDIKWRTVKDFRGGTYTFRDGKVTPVTRPDAGGWKGTVIINQSTKPLIVYVVPYATAATAGSFPEITWDVGWTVAPDSSQEVPRVIGHIGSKQNQPPKTILSHTGLDTLLWMTWD